MEIKKDTMPCACSECHAHNFDSSGGLMLGKRVENIYVLHLGWNAVNLCPDCLNKLIVCAQNTIQDDAKIIPGRPYQVGDQVWAVVKNNRDFQLEVVCAAVVAPPEDESLVIERKENALTGTRWNFPLDAWGREVFQSKAEAQTALEKIQGN